MKPKLRAAGLVMLSSALCLSVGCGAANSGSKANGGKGGGGDGGSGGGKMLPPRPNIPGLVPPENPVDPSCINVLEGPYDSSLPVPDNIEVRQDDYSARFQWGGDLDPFSGNRGSVVGYRVCWGPAGQRPAFGALFDNRIAQVFDVPNGEPQIAYIQSVDGRGNVSAPSQPISFTGDPTRVEGLRNRLTAFFDDFNVPGPVDELKWNVAFSRCNDPTVSATFVAPELHAINLIGNKSYLPGSIQGCDRAQNVNRPRAVFDFTGREGLIAFDFDGSDSDRSTWYLDVFPYSGPEDLIDITGHVAFDPGMGHPGNFLRFSQGGNVFRIHVIDSNGNSTHVDEVDISSLFPNMVTVVGVMRHWEIRLTTARASITVDGAEVLESTGLGLNFSKAILHWSQFAYNAAKIGAPWFGFNWDNFGFDGPETTTVTHNYKGSFNDSDGLALGWSGGDFVPDATKTMQISDEVASASAARIHYTLQNNGFAWMPQDSVTINGTLINLPEPESPTGLSGSMLIDDYRVFSTSIAFEPSILLQGANTLAFHIGDSAELGNIHIELDFPGSSAPAFTQPSKYISGRAFPELPPVGPTSIISRIGNRENDVYSDAAFRKNPVSVSGTVAVVALVDNLRPVRSSGKNLGVSKIELLVDNEVVETLYVDAVSPAPNAPNAEFQLDTTELSNGAHELFVKAYDAGGAVGRPGYPTEGENGTNPAEYTPITINVSN